VSKFYLSDDGVTWTQLGTTITTAGTISIFDSTTNLLFGGGPNAILAGIFPMGGTLHRVIIRDGFDGAGSIVFDADFESVTADALAFTESSTDAATVRLETTRYTYGIPNRRFVTVSTQAIAANVDYFTPFQITAPTVVDLLAWEITAAPSSTATVHGAIYAADGDMQPTGAPVATFGGVTVATSTTGVYTTQITPVTFAPGVYLLAFNSSQAFTTRALRTSETAIGALGASALIISFNGNRTNAAFPNPSAGWNARTGSSVGLNCSAVIRWRPA
jgi:hypothetical protein